MIRLIIKLCAALALLASCAGCDREGCDEAACACQAPALSRGPGSSATAELNMAAALGMVSGKLGAFQLQADVGHVVPPGSAGFDAATGRYTLKSAGANIWGAHDDFHFVYGQVSGETVLAADIAFQGTGHNPHRKAGLMIRQDLDAGAPYVDAMLHGDGSIALQYRKTQGGITENIKAASMAPARLRIERHGHAFTVTVTPKNGAIETLGPVTLELPDPVFAGLAVSAHDAAAEETAVFSNVSTSLKRKRLGL